MPSGSTDIEECLRRINEIAITKRETLTEEDLRAYFIKTGIIELLGYERIGEDIRLEKTIKRKGKRPDIQCLDSYGNVVFVVEFKKPSDRTPLRDHLPQLWERYVVPLRARHGVLTNGLTLSLFERIGLNSHAILERKLTDLTAEDCQLILARLRKTIYKMEDVSRVLEYFKSFSSLDEMRPLNTPLARELFFEDFALGEGSLFSELVGGVVELFNYQYGKSGFLTRAFEFWLKSYAKEPEKIPKSWERVLGSLGLGKSGEDLSRFMFCLETTYALFTRLILAKACEDHRFPHIDFSDFLGRVKGFRGEVPLVSWGILLTEWIENMRGSLVESIFEEDIFYWWTDKFNEMRSWDPWKLFSPGLIDNELIPFSNRLADTMFTLYKYDFSKLEGDPLGDLYQKYFDRETRKALGEFYTPKEVVRYILDAVGYTGRFITQKRLLDPACGSGTFLVEALKRYLDESKQEADRKGWGEVLRRLCNEFRIVGFDIHPFATIMAQIHFMLVLVPYYKKAIEKEKTFVLRRIPIFRTDSLVDEREQGEGDITLYDVDDGRDIRLSLKLPIKSDTKDEKFHKFEMEMPSWQDISDRTDLENYADYFCALQAIFDTVKSLARNKIYALDDELLTRNLKKYLTDKRWSDLTRFMAPYGNSILTKVEELEYKFGDGRLIKSIEDLMLAGLLKNLPKYDFVVGNPPYVRFHGIPVEDKRYYKKYYRSAYKQYDIYVLFLERGVKRLRDDGTLGYIVSSKFSVLEYGRNIRKFLLDSVSLKEIVDVSNFSVFRDAAIYPYIIIMDRELSEEERKSSRIKTALNVDNEESFSERLFTTEEESQSRFYDNEDFIFDLQTSESREVIKKIEKETSRLKDIADITRGFRPPPDHLVISEGEYNRLSGEDRKRYRKLVIGKDLVESYRMRWSGSYVEYKEEEIHESKPLDLFLQRKIMVRDIGLHPSPYFDEDGLLCLKTIYFVYDKRNAINLPLLAGILGSKTIEFYFYAKFWAAHIGGGYMRFRKQYLDVVPIKLPKSDTGRQIGGDIAKTVVKLTKHNRIWLRAQNFPISYVKDRSGIESEIVQHTFKSGQKNLTPEIQELVDGGYGIVPGVGENIIPVETKNKSEYVSASIVARDFSKGQSISIAVPTDDRIVTEILKEYDEDLKSIEDLRYSDLIREIDELVFDLYGLDKEDKKVISEFLSRF